MDGCLSSISIDQCIAWLTANGSINLSKSKPGIGTDFCGEAWTDVTQIGQVDSVSNGPMTNPPTYSQIMSQYYAPAYYHWYSDTDPSKNDEGATLENLPGGQNNPATLISYDNQRSVQDKMSYVVSNGLGRMIIWDLGAGYRTDNGISDPQFCDSLLRTAGVAISRALLPVIRQKPAGTCFRFRFFFLTI